MPDRSVPWPMLLGLVAVGVALRVGLVAGGLDGPFGEDAQYWVYRAVELRDGWLYGSHPPLYPLLIVLLSALTGMGMMGTAWWIAMTCGALAPAVLAVGAARLFGRRVGEIVGVGAVLLPALLAWSLRVEPTALFLVLLGACLVAAGGMAWERSLRAAVALGVCGFLIAATKENGVLYLPLLAVGAAMAGERRRRALLAASLGVGGLLIGGFTAFDVAAPMQGSVTGKTSLPFRELARLLETGELPTPYVDDGIPAAAAAWLQDADRSAVSRLGGVLLVQLWRMVGFLGLWLLVVPLAAWAAWRRAGVPRAQLGLALALQALLALAVVVILQGRHAEVLLLGTLLVLGLAGLSTRWLIAGAVPLAVQGAALLLVVHLPVARELRAQEAEAARIAAWAAERTEPDEMLCSPMFSVGAWLERRVRACFGGPPGQTVKVLSRADHGAYTRRRIRLRSDGVHLATEHHGELVLWDVPPNDRPDLASSAR